MALNGSGVFTRLYTWVTDRNNSVKITASRMDAEFDGMATALSSAIYKDGQQAYTANQSMAGYKITNLGNATADADALNRVTADGRYVQIADFDEQLASTNYASTDVASATTCDIGAATTARVRVTGTTTITSFGTDANTLRWVLFAGALTLTHNGTSLILPTAANITTVAGDTAVFASDGSGNWRCLYYQRASGAALVDLTPSASDTTAGIVELATTAEAEAGTDTARAVTPAGLLAAVAGTHTIWVPAAAMVTRTTNGAATGTAETSTNDVMMKTLNFDASTAEYAQFAIRMPKSWNEGTVTFAPSWSHAATTTNFGVVWALAGVAFADGDALDAAFGTAQSSTDTGGTTDDLYIGPTSSAITIAGTPAAEDYVVFQVSRLVSDGSDTMAVDARLHGITLYITTDAMTDD